MADKLARANVLIMAIPDHQAAEKSLLDLSALPVDTRDYVEGLQDEIARLNDKLTEQSRQIRDLRREVIRDSLTGLLNRRGFQRVVARTLDFVRRYDSQIALIFIDLDDFKRVNDTYGHACGDHILRHVAGVIRETLRSSDIIGRIGGDEFVALLWKSDEMNARETAARVVAALAVTPAFFEGNEVSASASVGVTTLVASDAIEEVLDRADKDMYRAKTARVE